MTTELAPADRAHLAVSAARAAAADVRNIFADHGEAPPLGFVAELTAAYERFFVGSGSALLAVGSPEVVEALGAENAGRGIAKAFAEAARAIHAKATPRQRELLAKAQKELEDFSAETMKPASESVQ